MEWNKTLAVTRESEGTTGFVSIPVDDILFFQIVGGRLHAHTSLEKYYLIGGEKLKRFLDILNASGYHFYRSDRSDIPNLSKIRKFDKKWFRAYFTEAPNSKDKYVYISRDRYAEFVSLAKSINPKIIEQ